MKIEKEKRYTLHEILKNKLLLSSNGTPYKTLTGIRSAVQFRGAQKEMHPTRHQLAYLIPGTTLITMNEEVKKLL